MTGGQLRILKPLRWIPGRAWYALNKKDRKALAARTVHASDCPGECEGKGHVVAPSGTRFQCREDVSATHEPESTSPDQTEEK